MTKPKKPMAKQDSVTAEELDLVNKWLERQGKWENEIAAAPYDGICGTLPSWIPRGINSEFVRLRHNLLGNSAAGEKITPADALLWMDRYARLGETDKDEYIPTEVEEVVGQLARWRYIVSLGPKKGLKELGVPSARFLGRKTGTYDKWTKYVAQLVKRHPRERADDLYRTLRAIAINPGDKKNPTPGECPFTADKLSMPPKLLKRGKPYLLSRFRNAVTEIKQRLALGEFDDL